MDELKAKLKRLDVPDTNPKEASFRFELAGVSEFVKITGNRIVTDAFWCRGLSCSLKIQTNLKEGRERYLSFFLFCHNPECVDWSCRVQAKFILFSKLSHNNYVYQWNGTFNGSEHRCMGIKYFISCLELTDEKNGYIRDDKIVLGIEMKAGPVIRKAQA